VYVNTGRLTVESITHDLPTVRVGRCVRVFDEVDSTNRILLSGDGRPRVDGMALVAERQTAGRGRMGRAWTCPRGAGILCSVLLLDPEQRIDPCLLSLQVPIGIIEGIAAATGVACDVKWPNDVMVAGKKLAGVLIEAARDTAGDTRYAVGFGINCLQQRGHFDARLRETSTSLELESRDAIDRAEVLRSVLRCLDKRLARPEMWDADVVRSQWRDHSTMIGSHVAVRCQGRTYRGVVLDVDASGHLLLQPEVGGRRCFSPSAATLVDG